MKPFASPYFVTVPLMGIFNANREALDESLKLCQMVDEWYGFPSLADKIASAPQLGSTGSCGLHKNLPIFAGITACTGKAFTITTNP
jgi:hypothetical protein